MTSQNSQPAKDNAKHNPFLWFHLILMAIAPWLLVMTMAGLAVGDPLLPSWLEISILSLPAIALPAWWQWQQPFSPFSLWLVAKPSANLSDRDRQMLTWLKQKTNGWYGTGWIAIAVAVLISGIFCKLYGLAPIAQAIAPFPDGFRFFGIIYAEICLFLSNIVLQSGISALRLYLVAETELKQVQPMAIDKIKNSFTSLGLLPEQLATPLLNLFEVNAPNVDEQDSSTPSQPVIQASQAEALPILEVTQEVIEPALETIEAIEVSRDKPIEAESTEITTLPTTEEAIAEFRETTIINEVESEQEPARSHEEIGSELEEAEDLVGDQAVEALVTNLVADDALLNQELNQETEASTLTANPVDELIEEAVLENEETATVLEADELIEESSLENEEEISDKFTDVVAEISSEDTGEELLEETTLEIHEELALELPETNTVNELLEEIVFINEANGANEDSNLAVIEPEELSEDLTLKQEEVIADILTENEDEDWIEDSSLRNEELTPDPPEVNVIEGLEEELNPVNEETVTVLEIEKIDDVIASTIPETEQISSEIATNYDELDELIEESILDNEEFKSDVLADDKIGELSEDSSLDQGELISDIPTTNAANEFLGEPKLENSQVDQEVKQNFEELIEEANIETEEITVDTDEKAIAVSEPKESSIHESLIEEPEASVDQDSELHEDSDTNVSHPHLDPSDPNIPVVSLPASTPKSRPFGFNLPQKSRKPKLKTQGFGKTVRQEPVAAPTNAAAEPSLIESLPEQPFVNVRIDESDSSDNSTNNLNDLNDLIDEVEELDEKTVLDNYAENILYEYFAEPSEDVLEEPSLQSLQNSDQSDQDTKANSVPINISKLTLEQKPQTYLVEEFLMDKFFAKLEKLNNSDRLTSADKGTFRGDTSSESSDSGAPESSEVEQLTDQLTVDEFDALEALLDRDQNSQQ